MHLINRILFAIMFSAVSTSAIAEDRALVIGIDKYPEITREGVLGSANLNGAVIDARAFASFLVSDFGFQAGQVRLLTDGQASKQGILKAFQEWLVEGTREGDRVVLFYAGHGAQAEDRNGDEPQGDLFDEALAPSDTAGEIAADPLVLTNLLIDDEISLLLEKVKNRQVFVFVDSCFAGTITRGNVVQETENLEFRTRTLTPRSPADPRGIKFIPNEARKRHKVATILVEPEYVDSTNANSEGELIVWTATASSQLALDTPSGGLFTQAFLTGLREKAADVNGDGKVLAGEALTYLQSVSEERCKLAGSICNAGLTPTLEADDAYLSQILAPVELAGMPNSKQSNPAYTASAFFSHANDFTLDVDILPTENLPLGSTVKFQIRLSDTAKLILLDQSPDGSVTQIFPNQFSEQQQVGGILRANAVTTIPDPFYGFEFKATEPGKSRLIAIAVEPDTKLAVALSQHLTFERIADANNYLEKLAAILLDPVLSEEYSDPNRRRRWAFATKEYEVQ